MSRFVVVIITAWSVLLQCVGVFAEESLRTHRIDSERQSAPTLVRVLLPDHVAAEERLRVLYVLPVEAGETTQWGDSMAEVVKHDLHNRHRLICVFPTFADLPWYADHPDNARLQQESYFLKDVLPLVEREYNTPSEARARLLVGFSKSGWGAWSLLLRHPDFFAKAAAFDAPLMMDAPGKYGSGPIFGHEKNFRDYQITLLLANATSFRNSQASLALFGRGNFDEEHRKITVLATDHHIRLFVEESQRRAHSWHSGWLKPSVDWLATE